MYLLGHATFISRRRRLTLVFGLVIDQTWINM